MEETRERRQSNRIKERPRQRSKYRDVPSENVDSIQNYPNAPIDHTKRHTSLGRNSPEYDYSNDVHSNQIKHGNENGSLRRSRYSTSRGTRVSTRNSHTHEYINDLNQYAPEQYDDDTDENSPIPKESVLSGSNLVRSVSRSFSGQPVEDNPYGTSPNYGQPVESVSDINTTSLADGTPRALGGSQSGFWNPDLRPSNVLPAITPQPEHHKGVRKLFASFRRLKRNKENPPPGTLAERNTGISQSAYPARVIMLDGEELSFDLDKHDNGHVLLNRVCNSLDIVETDYFGLTYVSNKLRTWFWLDPEQKIIKQLKNGEEWLFSFQVKFYPPEPTLLQEDITRYQLTLQVRQDIYTGKLPCSWVTQALLGSFMVQAELGDYDEWEHGNSIEYLKEFEFVPSPTPQLLQKIAELHKTHVGMKPNQADIKYLETAKRLELYGIDLHPVRDTDNVEIYLGVGFHGIVIYRDRLRIGRFAWPKVLRISYKKNNFYLKIRPDNSEPVETIIGFRLLNHHLANRLWKAAVEHHAFFRLKEARSVGPSAVLRSNFNFTGHTFFQYRTMNINRPHPHFDRSLTKRKTASVPLGLNKSSSIHTLNRAHPRDMTVGRTQELDNFSSRAGSTAPPARQFNSTTQLYSTTPRSSHQTSGRSDSKYTSSVRHRSNHSNDSQTHDYVNQAYEVNSSNRDQDSYLSASVLSGPTAKALSPRTVHPRRSNLHPQSPVSAVSPQDPYSPHDRNQSFVGGRHFSGTRKPPGGVPALGGVMLKEYDVTKQNNHQTNEFRQNYDDEEEDVDLEASLEYDDNAVDESYYPDNDAYGVHRVDRSSGTTHYKRNNSKPFTHAPRRERNNAELML